MGYINGGDLGSIFDNNDTTGVDFEKNQPSDLPHIIVITMPVFKTFKGKLKMNLGTPWSFAGCLPSIMTINTANSFTNNDLQNRNYAQNLSFFRNFRKIEAYGSKPTNEYLESVVLNITGNTYFVIQSWDIEFTKPFNSIIFEIVSGFHPRVVWITSISFEKSR